jgi:hypothetical protein
MLFASVRAEKGCSMNRLVRTIQGVALALVWISASVCAHADTILSTASTVESTVVPFSGAQSVTDQQYLAYSFSLGNAYDDVSIRFHDLNYTFDNGIFWLTDALGPATTISNVIATSTFSGTGHFNDPNVFTALSGLTLGAGTYFMIFSSPLCDVGTDSHCLSQIGLLGLGETTVIDAAPGVTYNGGYVATDAIACHDTGTCEINFAFAPASLWNGPSDPNINAPRFEIAGTAIAEPESMWLLGAGLAIMGVTRRLRKGLVN